jgi:amino acid adenylation domain-containing protein
LVGLPAPIELPADRLRASGPLLRRELEILDLPEGLLDALEPAGHRPGKDLPVTLLAGFFALLHRYTGREDLVVGVPLADAGDAALLPLRVDAGGDPSFAELLGRVREAVRSAGDHQDLSLEELLEELRKEMPAELEMEPDPSRHPLFQVAFVHGAKLKGSGPGIRPDLELGLVRRGGRLVLAASYASDLFEAATVRRLLGHFLNLLVGIAEDGEGARVSDLPLLGSEERKQVLSTWSGAEAEFSETPVHEIFLQRARARPEALAVSWDGGSMTYGELLDRSLRVAAWLRRRGLGGEDLVALRLERSPELVVSSLGVLLSGAAYLPIDPANPSERLAYVVRDSGASLLLTVERLRLPGLPLEQVVLESLDLKGDIPHPEPHPEPHPDRLAYVIYTSGSTGAPKGTDLLHRGLSNTIAHYLSKYLTGADERLALLASPGFDASVLEIWLALTTGSSLHVAPAEILASAPDLLAWYAREGITHSYAPPVQVEAMLGEIMPPGLELRRILSGGDRLRLRPRADCPFVVVNNYGPTEVSIATTEAIVATDGDRSPTIGRPLDNVRVYLLDAAFQPVPAGVPGELYIGGEGVARGYRGRPGLTAERFVPDPFGPPGARLYRSGDLARWLQSGEIDFIGRADHQVKLRGFRIELGEVESVLLGHPGVREAAVLLRTSEGRLAGYLAGYVALAPNGHPDGSKPPSIPELREHLASQLPEYMVPTAWAVLESLPVNASGKVDRRALERMQTAAVADEAGDTAPRTQLEELLAGLFAEVLDIADEGVGIHQDFFQLGGHSLLATRLTSRVRELCGVELSLRSVFEHPTVASLASWIERQQGRGDLGAEAAIPLTAAPAGPVLLSSAQQRLWFLERLRPGTALYNLAQLFDLRGELTVPALAAAFDAVVRRHEALRTLFASGSEGGNLGGDPVQLVCREPLQRVPLPVVDLGSLPEPARHAEAERITSEEARRPYDLERGPLMRTALLRLGPEEHRLLVGTHHIVSDAWSVGVLLRELSALYRAALTLHASPLPPLPVQYPGFAVWQHRRLTEEAAEAQLSWWREHLAGVPTILELQADRPRPAVPSLQGERLRLPLGAGLEPALAALGRRQGATLFMTLLAAFQALLHRYTLQEDFVVGSPVAGRDRLELEALIGFFVNMLPLRASASETKPFSRLLAGVRESVLAAFAHQDLPFDRLVEELAPQRDLSRTPLFQVAFAFQEAMADPNLGVQVTAAAEVDTGVSKFDLTLLMERGERGIDAIAEYSSDLFERETVQRMLGAFRVLVAGALADPAAPLGELPLLASEEREQVVSGWNRTAADLPATPVHHLFERRAAADPGALAVASAEEALTYGELDRRANLLAWRLRRLGIGPEDVVGLLLERSPELPLAALATLKAGGAYLPIDPAYPAERVLYVLRDAGAQALLTTSRIIAGLPEVPLHTGRMILLDGEPAPDESSDESKSPPPASVEPDGLAYVIYTSGSTGMPKGTELHHRGLCNLLAWHDRAYGLNAADRASLVAGPGFDASVFEMWPPLVAGSSVHVPPLDVLLSPSTLLFWLAERGVTVAFLPTPLAEGVLAEPMPADLALRLLTVGGDRLIRRPAAGLRFPLVNHYGPTEATVITTTSVVAAEGHRTPHIGGPIANFRVHLLDRGFAPLPVGVPGELCVAGVGLARGYRRRPDLTAERFVPDPLGGAGDRLYRTGDLARRLPGGEIEFLGRLDQQVKIRGYRIEMGEIEAAMCRHPGVREAVALVRETDRRLVGCVVMHEAGELNETGAAEALRASLAGSLPEVMIPTAWVFLEALPLTPNGKVDRRALARIAPAPEAHAASAPPRTPTEAAVAEVWSDLLGVEGIGAFDDFFALGGHSLLAARLAARIQERLGVELPLRMIFQEPTVARLAAWIEAERHHGDVAIGPSLAAGVAAAPLSFAQQRLWLLDRMEPGSAAYNMPILLHFSGSLRPDVLALVLAEVVRRHAALRTTFEVPEGAEDPVQVVHPLVGWNLPLVDLAALPGRPECEAEVVRVVTEEASRPFDLQRGPLLRTALLRMGMDDHRLVVTMHHIVSDGWSVEVLLRELGAVYRAFIAGRPSPLLELPVQYPDFSVWQRNWLAGEEQERQLAYWRRRLDGMAMPQVLELPADRPRPTVWSYRGAAYEEEVTRELAGRLEQLGQRYGATPFMTFLAAFFALLHRYTAQEDLLVGAPLAGRGRPEIAGLIGFFVNSLALRVSLAGDPAFPELLARVREAVLGAHAHQDLPFEKLVADLVPSRDLSRNPLFQVMLAFQSSPPEERIAEGLAMKLAAIPSVTAKFDLTLGVRLESGRTVFDLEYSTDLFDAATMRRFVQHFVRLLEGIVEVPARRASELPLLTEAEAQQLVEWNDTAAAFPEGFCLHELIEGQVERTPERPAVTCDGRSLTYRELNEAADRLARRLRAAGVGPERVVGVLAERSLEMVVGLLAVLKAGGAYLPLDPDHPSERLALMLADSGARLVLVQKRLQEKLAPLAAPILPLDGVAEPGLDAERPMPRSEVHPDNLAYVIYTSGSTGLPKGAMVPHRAILNHMFWMQSQLPLGSLDRVLQKTTFSFDASIWEFWAPLMAGSLLVMALPGEQRDPGALVRRIQEDEVTVLQVVPSLLGALLEVGGFGNCRSLRRVCCGGEALSPGLVADFFRVSQAELHNLYGPTEAAVDATSWACEWAGRRGKVPIGRPVSNTRIHVVDRGLRAVPVGVPGELLIGGVQVGRGYLARPELTAARFVPDPISGEAGARLYRTGDLVRRLPDGTVDFLGRIDHQVKLRGLRIELGEIEAALCRHPGVSRAAVLAREERIGAFYVPAGESIPGPADLAAELRRELPEYMVPAWFVALPALPLTANGKIDRRALAGIAPAAVESVSDVPPRTPVERELARIWSTLLGVEGIGAHDDFFALGGHSLLAARLTARVHERLGVDLPLRVIFQEPTVARLAGWIEAARQGLSAGPSLVAGLAGEVAPLSFAQQRLWFFEQLQPGSPAYNIPIPFRLAGPLRPELLTAALGEVVRRHGTLRTTFEVPEGTAEPVQVVHPAAGWHLPVIDLGALPPELREAEAGQVAAEDSRRPFDIRRFPLIRTTLLRLGASEHRLLATLHHIISDGWSMEILERELGILYDALSTGRPSLLPELPVQYDDFAVWQRSWLSGHELERQLSYWRSRLAEPPALELPTDHPRPAIWSQRGAMEAAFLPGELADRLDQVGRSYGATSFMTLFAAFLALLQRYTSQEDLVVGTPLAGRGRPEIQDLIGFFVNTLALRVSLDGDPSFETLLARVRECVLEAYDHQDVPFEKLVAELAPTPDLSRNPLFQVAFTVQERQEPVRIGDDLVLSTGEWVHHGTAKFDLSLHAQRTAQALELLAEYGTDLFDGSTVRRLLGHFRRLVEGIVAGGEQARLSELPLLDAAEREQVLTAWNQTAEEIPDEPVHRLIFRWAEVTPDAVAVSWEGGSLTYAGLARRAADLAGRLLGKGVGPETVVALRLERSADLVAAALAVLETGGAYLPIDPAHPEERAEWIVRDSGAALLLTAETLEALEREAVPSPARQRRGGRGRGLFPNSLAYIIYTSGSTGTPKGTELCHRGLSNLIAWHRRTFALGPGDRSTLLAGPGFDASIWEMWFPLTAGAAVHMPPRDVMLSPPRLLEWIAMKGLTFAFLPTPLAEAVLFEPLPAGLSLRTVFTGGDRLRLRPKPDLPFALINLYGPTECTVMALGGRVAPAGKGTAELPEIGSPIANTRAYILDRWLQPVPVGVPGEICLAGEGLARCYRNRPELTARAFVPDPFDEGKRLYRTGDLGRWLPSGKIEFLGRADHQVKIRGQRIELGEIEASLGRHPAVRDSVVLLRDERLVAYVVTREAREAVTVEALRAWLARSLPDAMIPAAWAFLDALPRTPNGKVDRRALPSPAAPQDDETFVHPSTPTQRALARIWGALLGLERVGAQDNFFQLGGHSLSATQMATRVHERFGINLELRAVFENPVLQALAAHVDSVRGALQSDAESEGMYPLSFGQQRLWFLDRLQPGSAAYNIPALLRFSGPLRPEILAAVLTRVVSRHAALRTTFETSGGGDPVQVVHRPAPWSLPLIDLAGLSADEREAEAWRLTKEEAEKPFDLQRGPMLRTALLRLGRLGEDTEHWLLATMHHIVADGWSLDLFLRELGILYGACAEGRPSPLPELPMQYPDFAVWQRSWLTGDELERQLGYWRVRLAQLPVFELPMDRSRPAIWSFPGGVVRMELPETLAGRLERFGQSRQATPFMTLFAGFLVLLHRYTGKEDLLVGTPVAGRSRVDIEELIGFFVNMLPLRVSLEGEPTFLDVLDRVRESALAAYAYQDIPFEKLVAEVAPERDLSRNPLFQVLFAFLDGGERTPIAPGLTMTLEDLVHSGTSKFDLSFHVTRAAGRLHIWAEYATALFDRATVLRLSEHFGRLLEEALAHPELPVARLPLLGEAERAQLAAWDEAGRRKHPEGLLHGLFEAQAERTPEAVALVAGKDMLSYAELEERSSRLAGRLRALGAGPEVGVAVCLERTTELVVALLAVLRSGSFYVPLDPRYPAERLSFLLEDSGAWIVVTESQTALERLPLMARTVLLDRPEPVASIPDLPAEVTPGNLAYLIYTSGSTGKPKAVAIEHRSATVFAQWAREAFSPEELCSVLASTSVTFDLSVFEIFVTLAWGGTVVLVENALADFPAGAQAQVTLINTVPSAMAELLRNGRLPASVRTINLAGEALPRSLADRAYARAETDRLCNLYGPSEDTTYSTWTVVERAAERPPSIGRPVHGTSGYVLDRNLDRLPVRVPGELCLAGAGLARGYLGRPELTAERFLPDPFSADPGARMYRTGDLVRLRQDGDLDYLGRLDHQVKVRGFRIELGEVEAALARQPGVESAVALAREDVPGDKRLVAYVVAPVGKVSATDLRHALLQELPDPMVPSAFVFLEALPLTPHGKVDRRSLPAPDAAHPATAAEFVPPRTPLEEEVGRVWAEVLGVERVGSNDNFWELGGHSLLATRALARLEASFGVTLPLQSLFGFPTLAGFSSVLAESVLAGEGEAEIDEALAALGDMSEEEVRALIEQTVRELEELA